MSRDLNLINDGSPSLEMVQIPPKLPLFQCKLLPKLVLKFLETAEVFVDMSAVRPSFLSPFQDSDYLDSLYFFVKIYVQIKSNQVVLARARSV